ncbi:hypothetical protein G6F65_019701 [Rhizopus arrhizus]|nr:hypothetical protein G6F65_019701 [Rhizopus arrhizus]
MDRHRFGLEILKYGFHLSRVQQVPDLPHRRIADAESGACCGIDRRHRIRAEWPADPDVARLSGNLKGPLPWPLVNGPDNTGVQAQFRRMRGTAVRVEIRGRAKYDPAQRP